MRRVAPVAITVLVVAVTLVFAAWTQAQSPTASPVASPFASPAASPVASPVSCAGVQAWLTATQARANQAAKIITDAVNPAKLSNQGLQAAAQQLRQLAAAQRAMATPPEAKAISQKIAGTLQAYADAISQVASAVKSGNMDELNKGLTAVKDAGTQLQGTAQAVSDLATACGAKM